MIGVWAGSKLGVCADWGLGWPEAIARALVVLFVPVLVVVVLVPFFAAL